VAVRSSGPPGDERETDQFAVRVKVTREQARALLRREEFDFGDHPRITENPDGTGNLDLFISRAQIEALRAEGYEVDVGHNLSARARSRLNEIGRGDRFEGGKVPPRGLGRKFGGPGRPQGPTEAKPKNRHESSS
jgi:hypothetical protein